MTNMLRRELRNLVLISLGSTLLALGVVLFLAPNRIATGGTPGVAILLHFVVDLPIGGLMVLINLPLLLAGWRLLGRAFALRTVGAILLMSVLIDLFTEILKLPAVSNNQLLATLYGGIVVGLGVGLILRGNASAGGSTIIAKIVSSRTNIKPGQVIFALDLLIVCASALVFRSIEPALWSLICIYVTSKCIDMILTGALTEKVVHIATRRPDELARQLIEQLGRHGTMLSGTGLFRNQEKTLIFVTVEARRISLLRDIIRQTDPDAFMVVMDAAEMLGRGHGV
ncbi:YitT family protein [Geopsychrobacter electrodiphilus]|uniref:YitT family protein n=1 Tax=Geopsychrobacter electrodiphilus TaxID=225196 RepID=UPI000361B3E5|nr:YitT family protein [Geopsychrobacter electrodiphilus]